MEHLNLSDLNRTIKECLQANLEDSYWVIAEIGEIRVNQKGHCYLEMVEKSGDEIIAKSQAIIWSYTYRNLSGWFETLTGQSLKPGLKILSNLSVNFHEVYGLSLIIKDIDASYTLGERAKKRLEILDKLEKEGVIDMNRQLSLPLVPQRIALIASSTSAGYHDFMSQVKHNPAGYKFHISLYQALMQGNEAERSIIEAMHEIHKDITDFDLLVIIRGGGATLDLECFDTYNLAAHVAQFPIPVITGIGHERDETITDIVAHTNLKTPTAVAEFLIGGCREFEEHIHGLYLQTLDQANHTFREQGNHLEYISKHLKYISEQILKEHGTFVQSMIRNIRNTAMGRKRMLETLLSGYADSLRIQTSQFLVLQAKDLINLSKSIELADPKKILGRGYSLTRKDNRIVKSVHDLHSGDIIETEFVDGRKESRIFK